MIFGAKRRYFFFGYQRLILRKIQRKSSTNFGAVRREFFSIWNKSFGSFRKFLAIFRLSFGNFLETLKNFRIFRKFWISKKKLSAFVRNLWEDVEKLPNLPNYFRARLCSHAAICSENLMSICSWTVFSHRWLSRVLITKIWVCKGSEVFTVRKSGADWSRVSWPSAWVWVCTSPGPDPVGVYRRAAFTQSAVGMVTFVANFGISHQLLWNR